MYSNYIIELESMVRAHFLQLHNIYTCKYTPKPFYKRLSQNLIASLGESRPECVIHYFFLQRENLFEILCLL